MWGKQGGHCRMQMPDAACIAEPAHRRRLAAGGSLDERKVAVHSEGVGRHSLDEHREHPHIALQSQARDSHRSQVTGHRAQGTGHRAQVLHTQQAIFTEFTAMGQGMTASTLPTPPHPMPHPMHHAP